MTFRFSIRRCVWLIAILAFGCGLVPALRAQAPAGGPEALAAQGLQAFESGDYKTAAERYEQLLKEYPTSQVVPAAQFYGGYFLFLLGEHDRAIELLRKATALPATQDIQELAQALLPQAMAAKAGAMPAEAPGRTQAFLDAVEQFDNYLKRFPGKDDTEAVQYGRALAFFQIGRYADAIKDLRANVQQFSSSRTVSDSQYLLALALAAQANKLVSENPGKRAEAEAGFDEAERILKGLIAGSSGAVIANDARFQLGEIYLSRAALVGEDRAAQRERVREALKFYRMVEPKATVLKNQEARIEEIKKARVEALQTRNQALLTQLRKAEEKERGRLEQIKGRPEQTLSAGLKAAEAFFLLGDYDAARVAFNYLSRFLENDDQKKTALYYRTMTYAVQNRIEEAMRGYEEFQAKYKGDPMAENLPVAIGSMFLTSKDPKVLDPQKAIDFFTQAMQLYPKSRFLDLAVVQKATAQIGLRQFDEALKTFQDFLAAHPDARPEVRAQAELGIANIHRETGRWDDAIAAYNSIRQKYASLPETLEQAVFWSGWSQLAKGDAKAGIAELRGYLEKYPEGKLAPVALLETGKALHAMGQSDEALKLYEQLAERFPDSEPATFSYFQRAQIHAAAKEIDKLVAVLRSFIEKYPKDSKVFAAYDSIGGTQMNAGQIEEALATYRQFAERYPDDANAPRALVKASELARTSALAIGRNYVALDEAQRKTWTAGMEASLRAGSEVIERFPKSDQVSAALASILETEKLRVVAGIATPEEVEKFFADLAASHEETPEVVGKIRFAHAAFIHPDNPDRAFEMMRKAYRPDLLLTARNLDLYGSMLIQKGNYREAEQIYRKLGADYPNPERVDPKRAPLPVMEAQSTMLYGLGAIAQREGKLKEAEEYFTQLNTLYPWSPKKWEATFGIAQARKAEGKADEALQMLIPVIRLTTEGTEELRAKAMLLAGHIYKDKGQIEGAIDNFIKIAAYYEGVPGPSAEGLWEGGQLLEQQAAGITDPKRKAQRERQLNQARRAYEDLIRLYPNSSYTPAARQRLQSLGSGR